MMTVSSATAQPARSLEGMWQGALSIQGMKLRIVFNLTPIGPGYRATMDSPDQGAKGIPTDTVILQNDSLRILMRMIGGTFAGHVLKGDSVIAGTWSQSGTVFPLELKRSVVPVSYRRPQMPQRPLPYKEEEVSVPNRSAGITLAGTLTIPEGPGPHPAVVLITGSGAQDRDETIFEHKPFFVLADHLTRKGIAVLRMDDRGVGKSGGTMAGATSLDFATDIESTVDLLRGRAEILKDKIGLIGHSEGGIVAPIVAARRNDVAFIVMLAGPSTPGTQILVEQDSLISLANGAPMADLQMRLNESRELFDLLRSASDTAGARKAAEDHLYAKARERNTDARPDSILRIEAANNARRLASAWMRFFLFYDPMETLRKVRCPVLALLGEKDLQVPAATNLRGIEQAARDAGNNDVTVRVMPGLNHLFQTAKTGSPMEYAAIEETLSPSVLTIVSDWIGARVPPSR
jgi:hypothetical protein